MRYCLLILLLFTPFSVFAQDDAATQAALQDKGAYINNILMEGLVLDDKARFARLFKPYRGKYLTAADIDTILQQLQEIYEEAGFQGLVSMKYHIQKKSLTFTITLIQ